MGKKQAASQVAIYIYLLFPHLYLSLLPNKPACKRSQGRISSFKDSMKFKLNQSTCLRGNGRQLPQKMSPIIKCSAS